MSYRAFRTPEDQARAEAAFPARFGGGGGWTALALAAATNGAVRRYTVSEWAAATSQQLPADTPNIVASALWALRPEYEQVRLAAKYVTIAGLETIFQQQQDLAVRLRAPLDPASIRALSAASYILAQAALDPDRRASFSKFARDMDIQHVAIYSPATAPQLLPTRATVAALAAARIDQALLAEVKMGGLRYTVEQIRAFAREGRLPPEWANYTRTVALSFRSR